MQQAMGIINRVRKVEKSKPETFHNVSGYGF